MTTLATQRTTHHLHLPREVPRRAAASLVALLGAAMLVMTFANNLFKVGPSFESLMDGFRPHLTDSAMATTEADLSGLRAAGAEMQATMLPALAQQMGMTPAQLTAYLQAQFPEVATGVLQLPQIVTTFDGLVATLDAQRPNFSSADAIPTQDLPATTVPWSIAVAGGLLVGVGAVLWFRPRRGAVLAVVLGGLLVAGSAALSLPGKASDADDLNTALKPVYTAALVEQANGALATVSAMGTQLQAEMLPALATQLGMTPAQVQQMLATSFPATAAALQSLPSAMPRFEGLVGSFDAHLDDYRVLKPVGFAPIIWTAMGIGLAAALVGGALLLWPRHQVVSLSVR